MVKTTQSTALSGTRLLFGVLGVRLRGSEHPPPCACIVLTISVLRWGSGELVLAHSLLELALRARCFGGFGLEFLDFWVFLLLNRNVKGGFRP
ncbi:hypothetical protein DOM22_10745 [Bdellovibrio sp. ZAP7]|nr:hypothetical protein DOM22_10745 [Bdellovibrio sp. ZAP7]